MGYLQSKLKKQIVWLLVMVVVAFTFMIALTSCKKKEEILIINFAENNQALVDTQRGFIDYLNENGISKDLIAKQDANLDVKTVNSIANTSKTKKYKLILGIATPVAQSLKNVYEGTNTPILFTAITDPISANLVKNEERPGGNMTGTSDLSEYEKQIELMKVLKPDVTVIGGIGSSAEPNSKFQLEKAKEYATTKGIEMIIKYVPEQSQVVSTFEGLLNQTGKNGKKVEMIYTPCDTLILTSMKTLSQKGYENGVPIISGESIQVRDGALATYGLDYYQLGRLAGKQAYEILKNGKKPGDMKVERVTGSKLYINEKALNKLNESGANLGNKEEIGKKLKDINWLK